MIGNGSAFSGWKTAQAELCNCRFLVILEAHIWCFVERCAVRRFAERQIVLRGANYDSPRSSRRPARRIRHSRSLQNRFWYDEDRKCLAHDGAMCKATYDRVRELSSDFKYQRAVEELFRIAVPGDNRPKRNSYLIVVASVVAAVAACLVVGLWLWQRTDVDDSHRQMETKVTTHQARD